MEDRPLERRDGGHGSHHQPLTREQLDRIARNKAAALARLAQARQLAAWAHHSQSEPESPWTAPSEKRIYERTPQTNQPADSLRNSAHSAHFRSKQQRAKVFFEETKDATHIGRSAPIPLAGQLAILLGKRVSEGPEEASVRPPAVQTGVTGRSAVATSIGCTSSGQPQVESDGGERKSQLPVTGFQNTLSKGWLGQTGSRLKPGLPGRVSVPKAEQAIGPPAKRGADEMPVERGQLSTESVRRRSKQRGSLPDLEQLPAPMETTSNSPAQQPLGTSSDRSSILGAAADAALGVFAAAGNAARTSPAPVASSIARRGQSDCALLDSSVRNCGAKSEGELRESARADSKSDVQKVVPFLRWPRQVFDYFLVIDFECTCDNRGVLEPQEIIEFPSVLLNARTLRSEDSFQVFCRPEVHAELTPFCTKFTGIRQEQVDAGRSLQEALQAHDTWLRSKNLLDKAIRFAVVTWTDWDCKVMLEMECKWKNISKPAYFNQWINLKLPFAEVFPKAKGTCHGLKGHVTYAGVTWEGRAHSGLDDAKNTARLAAALIRQGALLKITNSFKIYAADGSKLERVLKKRPLSQADSKAGAGPVARGEDRCYCGAKRKRRTVKKPGPTHGHAFFSCGKWTIIGGGSCEYFEWASIAS